VHVLQQDKKAQAEQRAIQQTHAAITKALETAQQGFAEEEEDVVQACQEEQSGLRERLTGLLLPESLGTTRSNHEQ
jgi:hypothetical protein